jgi:hypothetical protein
MTNEATGERRLERHNLCAEEQREYWQTLHLAMVNGKYLQRRRGRSLSR